METHSFIKSSDNAACRVKSESTPSACPADLQPHPKPTILLCGDSQFWVCLLQTCSLHLLTYKFVLVDTDFVLLTTSPQPRHGAWHQ